MKKITFILFFLLTGTSYAQRYSHRDTLFFQLKSKPEDTTRLGVLTELINEVYLDDPKMGLEFGIQVSTLSKKVNYRYGIASGYSWQGFFYEVLGEMDSCINAYSKAIYIYNELDSSKDLSTMYNNLAYLYMKTGEPERALDYNFKGLKINIELKDTEAIVTSLLNTGGVYYRQDRFKKALESYRTALFLSMQMKDEIRIAATLRNIARVLKDQKDYEEAFYCYSMSYKFSSRINNKEQMVKELNGMGNIYELKGDYKSAYHYYKRSLEVLSGSGYKREFGNTLAYIGHLYDIQNLPDSALPCYEDALANYREIFDKDGICQITYYLGDFYFKQGMLGIAEAYSLESYLVSEKLGYPSKIMNSAGLLYKIYKAEGKLMEYITTYEKYVLMKDSVSNNEDRKLIEAQKEKFDEYRSTLLIELAEKEQAAKESARIFRRNVLQYSLILITVLLSFGLIFLMGYIKLPYKVAQALILVTLLSLFEFLLALTDPLFDSLTKGVPFYKVCVNLLLALSIFPIQTFMEKRLKQRINKLKS